MNPLLSILFVSLVFGCVVRSQVPPEITSYTADAKMIVVGEGEAKVKWYEDYWRSSSRMDDIATGEVGLIFEPDLSLSYTQKQCQVECVNGQTCPPGERCDASGLDFFVYLFLAQESGRCPDRSTKWVFSLADYGLNITFIYCIGNGGIPTSFSYLMLDVPVITIEYTDFKSEVPDESLFLIPNYCPCIGNLPAPRVRSRSAPSVSNTIQGFQCLKEKYGLSKSK